MLLHKTRESISAVLEFLVWTQLVVGAGTDVIVQYLQEANVKKTKRLLFNQALRYCLHSETAASVAIVAEDVLAVCVVLYGLDIALRRGDSVLCDKYDNLFRNAGGFYRPVHRMFKSKEATAMPTIRLYTLLNPTQQAVFVAFVANAVGATDPFAE